MAAHASFGGSTIKRRMNCLASHALEAAAPEPPTSKFAAQGIMLHTVAQRCVEEEKSPMEFIGYKEEGAAMTAALASEMIEPALAALERLLDDYDVDDYDVITEARVRYNDIPAFGTCDLLISTADFVFVIDWKFGRGVIVDGGPSNQQLRFYAGAAMETVPEYFAGDKQIVLGIIQPAADRPLTQGIIDRPELESWVGGVRDTVKKVFAGDVGDPVPGDWCRWCKAAPTCSAKRSQVEMALSFDPRDGVIDPIEFGRMYAQANAVEEWAKAVKSTAFNELKKGRKVDGYKLVEGRRTRKWDNEDAACAALLEAGINEVFEQKLISPHQAEKKVKSAGGDPKDIADLIVSNPPGLTIAPADDKRPAVFENGLRNASLEDLKLSHVTIKEGS